MPDREDLAGRRFGRLLAVRSTDKRDGSSVGWECICDCGNTVLIPARNLLHRGTVSCGCYAEENRLKNLSADSKDNLGQIDRTNVSRLRSDRPQRNNRSGYRGVSRHKTKKSGPVRWAASIYFKRTKYHLGLYDTPQEAHKAYLAAKSKLHDDFVAWYDQTHKNEKETD